MPRYRIFLAFSLIPLFLYGQDIDEAIRLFNAFQFKRSHEIFKKVVEDENNPRIAEAYYYLGRLSVNPDSALIYYNKVMTHYSQSRYADISYLETAKINIAREHYKNAITMLNALLRNYPDTEVKDETLFWLGVSFIASGQRAQGENLLEQLRTIYPKSVWTERVENILPPKSSAQEYYTVQVGSYRVEVNAQKYAEEIRGLGFDTKVVKAFVKGITYYRVWVGQFPSLETAKTFSARLDSLGIQGNVVKGY
ncbi:MAG: SPOR domain-containing protein [candidate division WOR-3 bacterium]|nr:MAG: SPOR domain-containing protein [candidate division WOR-3 bacterium]